MTHQKAKPTTRITSRDVAALAGVSQSTVSRVLGSGKSAGFISEETARRVREAAEQLGYSPHPIARALRGDRTNLIGLIVREIADPFFAHMIELISAEIRKLEMNMVLIYAHSDPNEVLAMTEILDVRQYDGMIFLGDLRNDESVLQSIRRNSVPAVALCRGRKSIPIPTINCDNAAGMEMLIEHVLSLGHRHLAFIDGGWYGDSLERRETFLAYKRTTNRDVTFHWVQAEANDYHGGYQAMQSLLDMVPRPTAVLSSDDSLAIGALKAATDAGIRVPADISLTGFDDIELSLFTSPSLTTVRQPLEGMVSKAVEIMMLQINGEAVPAEDEFITVKPELIVRGSTGSVQDHSNSK